MTGEVGAWTEAKVVTMIGAVLLFGGLGCLVTGYVISATYPDPVAALATGDDPNEVFEDLNDRLRLAQRFIDIGQPLAPAGAAVFIAGAVLPRAAVGPMARRAVGVAVVVGAALMAMSAGLVTTEVVWDDGFSNEYRVWSWINVTAWLGLAAGMVLLVAAFRSPIPADVLSERSAETTAAGASFEIGER